MGLSTLQTMSMLSFQSAAAQQGPPFNQGQRRKLAQEQLGLTKVEAQDLCTAEFTILNQGECIQFARDHPQSSLTEELCKEVFSPPVK